MGLVAAAQTIIARERSIPLAIPFAAHEVHLASSKPALLLLGKTVTAIRAAINAFPRAGMHTHFRRVDTVARMAAAGLNELRQETP